MQYSVLLFSPLGYTALSEQQGAASKHRGSTYVPSRCHEMLTKAAPEKKPRI